MQLTQNPSAHTDTMTMHIHTLCVCSTYSAYSVQPGHPCAGWMTVHFWVCIYLPSVTGGNVWEVRSAKPNSTADTHWTTYTHFPSHLCRDLHTPHTDHCPLVCLTPPPLRPHRSASLSFPTLYHQFKCSTLWEYGCAISLWWWEAEERRIMQKVKITILVQVLESVCVCTEMIKCGGNADVLGMLCHMTSLFPLSSLLDRAVQC